MPFRNGLLYIETTKQVYYPGEAVEGAVHLMVTEQVENAQSICLIVKGKETFNYQSYKRRDEESCRNHYQILDSSWELCKLHSRTIAQGQYTFKFKVQLPLENLPASFLFRQQVDSGFINAKIRYRIGAELVSLTNTTLGKYSKRFFVAHPPRLPRTLFTERHELLIPSTCCTSSRTRGSNIIEARLERNYYLSDEMVRALVKIDNSDGEAKCERLVVKLVKTLKLVGSNRRIYSSTTDVARAETTATVERGQSVGERAVKLLLSDAELKFDGLRDHKLRYFRPEDI